MTKISLATSKTCQSDERTTLWSTKRQILSMLSAHSPETPPVDPDSFSLMCLILRSLRARAVLLKKDMYTMHSANCIKVLIPSMLGMKFVMVSSLLFFLYVSKSTDFELSGYNENAIV